MTRVAWFFAQARRALANARLYPNNRRFWLVIADNYRQLAKDTRARQRRPTDA